MNFVLFFVGFTDVECFDRLHSDENKPAAQQPTNISTASNAKAEKKGKKKTKVESFHQTNEKFVCEREERESVRGKEKRTRSKDREQFCCIECGGECGGALNS
jgi:hypothetical protein